MTFILFTALFVLLTVALLAGIVTWAGTEYVLDGIFVEKRDYVLLAVAYVVLVASLSGALTVLSALI
ncbi:putative membrane protein [Rhodococcus phage RGL3]|uniref:Putative membrane protein n=1 Tax=Rhodococcus phage RGL3 TaxID=2922221 RepID=G9FHL6_9CAUD|nr:hypothetical protein RoPhRGL3_gp24 [Rhodococcus phage RGL3]AEV52104.1 putative membrane protein [Rhodococcus phage RGL3]